MNGEADKPRRIGLQVVFDGSGYAMSTTGEPTIVEALAMAEFAELMLKWQFTSGLRSPADATEVVGGVSE